MAESGKIKHDDLIEDKVLQPTIDQIILMLEKLKLLESGLKDSLKPLGDFFKNFQPDSTAKIKDFEKKLKDVDNTEKGLNETKKAITKTTEQLKIAQTKEAQELAKLKKQLQEQNKENKDNAKTNTVVLSTYSKLSKELIEARKKWKDLFLEQKGNTKEALALKKRIDELDTSLKGADAQVGQFQRNVGNYTGGIKEALNASGLFSGVLGKLGQMYATLTAILRAIRPVQGENIKMMASQTGATITSTVATEANVVAEVESTVATEVNTGAQTLNKEAIIEQTVATKSASVATSGFTKVFKILNTTMKASFIGLIALALGGLIAFFKKTEKGADQLQLIFAGIGAFVDVLIDRFAILGEAITLLFTGHFLDSGKKFLAFFDGFRKQMKDNINLQVELTDQLDKFEEAMNDFLIVRAKMNRTIAEARFEAEKENVTIIERIELLKKAFETEEDLVAMEKEFVVQRFAQAIQETNITKARQKLNEITENGTKLTREEIGLTNTLEEDRGKALEIAAEFINIETESLIGRRKLQTKLTGLIEEDHKTRLKIVEETRDREIEIIAEEEKKKTEQENSRFKKELSASKARQKDLGATTKKQREEFQKEIESIENLHQNKLSEIEKNASEKRKVEKEKKEKESLEATKKKIGLINQIEQEQIQGQIDDLDRRIAREKKAEQINIKEIESIIDEQANLSKRKLADDADFKISTEQLTAEEILLINEKLKNDLAKIDEDTFNKKTELKKSEIELNKKAIQQQKEDTIKTLEAINKGIQEGLDERSRRNIEAIEKEQKANETALNRQEQLAEKGLDNQLAFEEGKKAKLSAKLEREKIKEQQRKEAAELANVFLEFLKERIKENPTSAPARALGDTLIARAISKSIAGAFATGVEGLDGAGTGTSDSNIALLSKGESIITAKGTKENKGLATAMNLGRVDEYFTKMYLPKISEPRKESVNDFHLKLLSKQFKELNQTIKNKTEYSVNWDNHGARVEELIEGGNRKVLKQIKTAGKRL